MTQSDPPPRSYLEPITLANQPIAEFSPAMRCQGDLLILSGHVPLDANGRIAENDLEAQLDQVFANMATTLTTAGTDFTSLARITFYVRDLNNQPLDVIRAVRDRWINTDRPPASALIGVDALFHPDALVEVDGIACLPTSDFIGAQQ